MHSMTAKVPTLIIEMLRLQDGRWELSNSLPDFEREAWMARVAFYVRHGKDQVFKISSGEVTLSWSAFSSLINSLEQQCQAERQVEVIAPFARSTLQRAARMQSIVQRVPFRDFLKEVIDPVQEINKPAILSLVERNSCTLERFNELAALMPSATGQECFLPRDLLYMELADRRGRL